MRCGACGAERSPDQNYCMSCGASFSPDGVGAMQGDSTGGIIPYKNPHALTAYYLGCFSIIPVVGFFLGLGAVALGIMGLKKRRGNPVTKGSLHACVGILFGGLMMLAWAVAIVLAIISLQGGF